MGQSQNKYHLILNSCAMPDCSQTLNIHMTNVHRHQSASNYGGRVPMSLAESSPILVCFQVLLEANVPGSMASHFFTIHSAG